MGKGLVPMLESRSIKTYATASIILRNTKVQLSQDSLALGFLGIPSLQWMVFFFLICLWIMDPLENLM